MITDWLDKHGDPAIEKEVEEEAEIIVKRGSFTIDSQGNVTADNITIGNSLTMGYGATIQTLDMRDPLPIKAVERYGLYNRWKPNGITDNTEQWKRKNDFRNDLDKINVIHLNASCITARKVDFSVIKWDEERKMFYTR